MNYRIQSFPVFEVTSYETARAVYVMVWQVRAVRAIRKAGSDEETMTRIEFGNGDVVDTSDSVRAVLTAIETTLQPVLDALIASSRT